MFLIYISDYGEGGKGRVLPMLLFARTHTHTWRTQVDRSHIGQDLEVHMSRSKRDSVRNCDEKHDLRRDHILKSACYIN